MAVLTAEEIHNGRDGEADAGGGRVVHRYTRVFRVTTDSVYDDAAIVGPGFVALTGIGLGSRHPNHAAAFCQRINPRNESFARKVWIVTCAYSSERERSENPLAAPAEVEWVTEQFTRPYWKDRDGKAIVNSAGYYYDPPEDGDDSRWIASVTKNVPAVPLWFKQYRDATNSDTFVLDGLVVLAGEAKLMDMRLGKWQEQNFIRFRSVSLSIAIDENGWASEPLDQGFYEKDPADTTKRRRISDDAGDPVDTPVPLDGSGRKLVNPSLTNCAFRTHYKYKSLPFSILPIY